MLIKMMLKSFTWSAIFASVLAVPYIEERADAVCSTGIYGELVPLLKDYPIALTLCSDFYPVKCTTAAKIKRAPVATTTTTANSPGSTSAQASAAAATTSVNSKVSAWSKALKQAIATISTLCSCMETPKPCSSSKSSTTTTKPSTTTTTTKVSTTTTSGTTTTQAASSSATTKAGQSSTVTTTKSAPTSSTTSSTRSSTTTTSTSKPSTTSPTSTNTQTTTVSPTTTTSRTSSISTSTSAVNIPNLPGYYFKAYNNGFIADGTTLADVGGSAIFNDGNTPFAVNSTGFLFDLNTGSIGVISSGGAGYIKFVPEVSIDNTVTPCKCSIGSGNVLSCNCGGNTQLAADSDKNLLISSNAVGRRGRLVERAGTSSVTVSAATTAGGSNPGTTTISTSTTTSKVQTSTTTGITQTSTTTSKTQTSTTTGKTQTSTTTSKTQTATMAMCTPDSNYNDNVHCPLTYYIGTAQCQCFTRVGAPGNICAYQFYYNEKCNSDADCTQYGAWSSCVTANFTGTGSQGYCTDSNSSYYCVNGGYTPPVTTATSTIKASTSSTSTLSSKYTTTTTSSCPTPTQSFYIKLKGSTNAAYPDGTSLDYRPNIVQEGNSIFTNGNTVWQRDSCTGALSTSPDGGTTLRVANVQAGYDYVLWFTRPPGGGTTCVSTISSGTNALNLNCGGQTVQGLLYNGIWQIGTGVSPDNSTAISTYVQFI